MDITKNITRNMEAIFLAAALLTGVTSFAQAAIPKIQAAHAMQVAIAGEKMAVVTVKAKRMTDAQKARSL